MNMVYKKASIISLLVLSVGCADKQFDEIERISKYTADEAKKENINDEKWNDSFQKFDKGEITRGELLITIKPIIDYACSMNESSSLNNYKTEPATSLANHIKILNTSDCEWRRLFYDFVLEKGDLDPTANQEFLSKTSEHKANKKNRVSLMSSEYKEWCTKNTKKCGKLEWK